MKFSLSDFLQTHRSQIIEEWVRRIQTEVSARYARRPREELSGTVSEAFEGYFYVLTQDDFSYINRFIDKITRMRLEAGFPLSDLQKAFELYRTVVIPLLAKEGTITTIDDFCADVVKINRCMAYTIHCFSDYFQAMHERKGRLSAIGEAVAYVTHEIKNPLMLIGGFSNQVLATVKDRDERVDEKLRTIVEEVNRLEEFLKDIGRFAKEGQLNKRTVRLNQMIQQVTRLFQSEFAVRGIRAKQVLHSACGNIVADPDQLEQVLINLIKNATEAMPKGGTLSIKSYLENGKVCIEIADSGEGISKEDMENIFTPFFSTRKQGTGLGLSICRKIIDAHQGSLTISSEGPGNGTVATVQLPVDQDPPSA